MYFKRFIFLLFSTFPLYTTFGQNVKQDWNWNKTIENKVNPVINPGTDLTNKKKYNKTLFVNCTFTGGLNIKGIDSLYFYGCTFTNKGVKLGNRTTNNITFDNCTFKDVTANGIVTNINDKNDHHNLVIKDCHFENWGIHDGVSVCNKDVECNPNKDNCERCDDEYNKFEHGIYLRATDAIVKNCTFYHTIGGPAISVRNSAKIIGNTVYSDQTGTGGALGYWANVKAKGSKTLVVEGNTFIENAQNKTLLEEDKGCDCGNSFSGLVAITNGDTSKAVSKVMFRFNTLIVLDSLENKRYKTFTISDKFDQKAVMIYGNLFADFREYVDFTGEYEVDTETNLLTKNKNNFIKIDQNNLPYDTRLTDKGQAYNYLEISQLFSESLHDELKISVGSKQFSDK